MNPHLHPLSLGLACLRVGLLPCLAFCLLALAHAANPTAPDVCTDDGRAFEPAYLEAQKRPMFERFICQMSVATPAKPLEFVGTAQPLEFAPATDIGFARLEGAALVDVPGSMELIDTVNFSDPQKIDFATFSNLAQPASLTVGDSAVWLVTPGGVRVFDARTQRWSFSAKLSSDQVRPRDVVLDEKNGSVWFFGRDLYQYDITSHKIYRYKPQARAFKTLRKLVAVAGDLWLATDSGIFFFDAKRKVLAQLQTTTKMPTPLFTQVAANKGETWFSSGDARLLRLQRSAASLSAHISKPLGKLAPIELLAQDDGLWFLHSQDQGRSYQLASVASANLQLAVSKSTLYNLRASDGQVLASAYDTLFRVDTANRAVHPIFADVASIGAMTLGNRVTFSGSSYVNAMSTAAVGRYVLDLSKGWQKPASRVLFEAWGLHQGTEMFNWSPALLEVGANAREVWFLIAGNLSDARADRSFVARYDKRSSRAQVFFSRWTQPDIHGIQDFVVENATTTLGRRDP